VEAKIRLNVIQVPIGLKAEAPDYARLGEFVRG
jgi:hypothetical protein